ncbi:TetR/AcrR family transcriptional regulator [Amycolatopsis jejuensis]|uniref:TetR/AcrR family transcriptional regulator n=1 Tax=Amycolatopsis jejuensis TaxID=330084 RepID=UPI0012DFEADB|nr:TetR/AcrR family transcriptional regulator [Amycolatopsis jejuensis]
MVTAKVAAQETGQPPMGRVQRKRTQKIREILLATARVLNSDGYHAMNMDSVAEKMDLTKATLYHYFSSKDELVVACLNLVAEEVNDRLKELAAETRDLGARERLRALIHEQLVILLVDYPEAARLFAQPLEWPAEHRKLIRTLREPHDAVFREAVQAGVDSGELSSADPSLALHCIYGALNFAPVWARPQSRTAAKRLADTMCATLMKLFS